MRQKLTAIEAIGRIPHGAPVTIPRYMTNYVLTEYGVADLKGKTLEQRVEALVGIAHPKFRDKLWNEWEAMRKI